MESTLHPAVDRQEPDSERSPKRIRLDGALDVTEDVQEEIVDDDEGWDDIYATPEAKEEQPSAVEIAISNPAAPTDAPENASTDPTPATATIQDITSAQPNGPEPHLELASQNQRAKTPPNNQVSESKVNDESGEGDMVDGIPSEALYGGDELVTEAGDEMAVDRPGTQAMEGMSEVNGPAEAESLADAQAVRAQAAHVATDAQPAIGDGNGQDVQMEESELPRTDAHSSNLDTNDDRAQAHEVQKSMEAGRFKEAEQGMAEGDESDVKYEPTTDLLQMLEGTTDRPPVPKATDDAEFMAAAAAQTGKKDAEWQFDSSDAESSSDDSSDSDSDSDSSSSDESDGGYELLDAATAAKILMSGEGDDVEEGGSKKTGGEGPRTANEQKELAIKKPDVQVTADTKITMLGWVEGIVENMLLIKGETPGEYQVLESGSVLCNEKREVFGVVGDTLGRVQEPLYSVLFNNPQEIQDAGLEHKSQVYYVDEHSSYVFTQPLKNMKGTDASNIHDEEVGDDEIEFSDDEAEAEYKRQKKMEKAARRGDMQGRGGRGGRGRGGRSFGAPGRDDGETFVGNGGNDAPQQAYGGALAYDDGDAEDDFYKPLKRPDNLAAIMAGEAPPPKPQQSTGSDRGRGRGRGDFRGRGDRGGGRGRGDRQGRPRGGGKDYRGNADSFPDRHNNEPHPQRSNGYQARQPQPLPPRPASPPRPRSSGRPGSSHGYTPQQLQQYPQPYAYPPQPQQQPQTYQFNGYTYQYGVPQPPAPQQQATVTQPGYNYAAYGNTSYYPPQQQQPSYGFQAPQLAAQAQGAYGGAWSQHHQQAQQPGAGQISAEQARNLAAFLQARGQQQR